jgi:hypothetical protein
MGFDAFSGVGSLDTTGSIAKMFLHTPGLRWYGATDGLSSDKFFAVANPTYSPNPRAELFEIDTTTWTVNSLGFINAPAGGGPIREIGLDESTNTLYGTDYANLYTIPLAPGDVTAGFVGSFSPAGTPPANVIDYVFAMDYDPSVGQLVGTSWNRTANQSDLYSFSRTNGLASMIGNTGIDRLSDIWYSNGAPTLLGATSDGRILDVNSATGTAIVTGADPQMRFFGLANATPATPEPLPYVTAPLSNLGYETHAFAEIDSHVSVPGAGTDSPKDDRTDHSVGESADVAFGVPASVQGPGATPWQNTDGSVTIDLSNAPDIPHGIQRFSSTMLATATGSDEGIPGVVRHSGMYGTGSVHGAVGVSTPPRGAPGEPLLFGVGVYGWGDGLDLLTWNLVITDANNPAPPLS